MNKLFQDYQDRAAFFVVYIQEAHPSDLWQSDSNTQEGIAIASPQGFVERVNLAGMCEVKLGIKFPAVVDDFSNCTELSYTGWPDRMYVIDGEGHIAYKSDAGPYGFKPQRVREVLQRLLAR